MYKKLFISIYIYIYMNICSGSLGQMPATARCPQLDEGQHRKRS